MNETLWQPTETEFSKTDLFHFKSVLEKKYQQIFSNYFDLWKWSNQNQELFWSEIWDQFEVIGNKGSLVVKNKEDFLNSEWFPDSKINYAQNLLKFISSENNSKVILEFWGEDQVKMNFTGQQLLQLVSRTSQAFLDAGLKKGDRVGAMLPNHPMTLVVMLATTSLGGIWTSCSPDFGIQGVLDRFQQVEPKFFFTCDYYFYNGKKIDCLEKSKEISSLLTTTKLSIVIDYSSNYSNLDASSNHIQTAPSPLIGFSDFIKKYQHKELVYTQVEFNHPLFILYSSGTTGVPKCIVHGHGGTLLQHLKEHRLHSDVRPNDSLFYFTTCGWMMWNWLVSGLASQAKLLLYDGSPFFNEGQLLFEFLEAKQCTHFGTSAKFIDACIKANLSPNKKFRLNTIRKILSTGSPLSSEGFDYIHSDINGEAQIASISGGTDIISCFVLASPWTPTHRGEISVAGLGMDIDIWNEDGLSVNQEKGELVCKTSFPSKPVEFWNDPKKEKYKSAYFEKFPNVWCHGDFVEKTKNSGYIIYGRSDATLNPGGVRIGTAEIYRQVERLPEIEESIVVGQNWQNDVRVILFVKLKEQHNLTADLVEKIKKEIRINTTPRHVPAIVLQVNAIPRTKSGKIVELAVKQIIEGKEVRNKEALANPEALEGFKNRAELMI